MVERTKAAPPAGVKQEAPPLYTTGSITVMKEGEVAPGFSVGDRVRFINRTGKACEYTITDESDQRFWENVANGQSGIADGTAHIPITEGHAIATYADGKLIDLEFSNRTGTGYAKVVGGQRIGDMAGVQRAKTAEMKPNKVLVLQYLIGTKAKREIPVRVVQTPHEARELIAAGWRRVDGLTKNQWVLLPPGSGANATEIRNALVSASNVQIHFRD